PEHLARRIEALVEENKKLERQVGELLKGGGGMGDGGSVAKIGDVELHVQHGDFDDRDQIGLLVAAFRAKHKSAILVLTTKGGRGGRGKASQRSGMSSCTCSTATSTTATRSACWWTPSAPSTRAPFWCC